MKKAYIEGAKMDAENKVQWHENVQSVINKFKNNLIKMHPDIVCKIKEIKKIVINEVK